MSTKHLRLSQSFELISLAEEIFKMSSIDYVTWLLVITYSDLQYKCVIWTKRTKKTHSEQNWSMKKWNRAKSSDQRDKRFIK